MKLSPVTKTILLVAAVIAMGFSVLSAARLKEVQRLKQEVLAQELKMRQKEADAFKTEGSVGTESADGTAVGTATSGLPGKDGGLKTEANQ